MKKSFILLLLVTVAGAAIISLGQDTPGEKPAANGQVAEMQNRISELQSRIQSLEGQLKELKSTVKEMQRPRLQPLTMPGPFAPLPKGLVAPSEPPKIWGEREINGWTYYIVPCGEPAH